MAFTNSIESYERLFFRWWCESPLIDGIPRDLIGEAQIAHTGRITPQRSGVSQVNRWLGLPLENVPVLHDTGVYLGLLCPIFCSGS